jgi:hypothetical protein
MALRNALLSSRLSGQHQVFVNRTFRFGRGPTWLTIALKQNSESGSSGLEGNAPHDLEGSLATALDRLETKNNLRYSPP